MKTILREITVYTLSLYFTSLLFTGLKVEPTLSAYFVGGVVIAVGFYLIKPILTILTLPFHIISFGLFSFITSTIVLYLITFFYSGIVIRPFIVPTFSLLGLQIKNWHASGILSYIIISGTIYIIHRVIMWIFDY